MIVRTSLLTTCILGLLVGLAGSIQAQDTNGSATSENAPRRKGWAGLVRSEADPAVVARVRAAIAEARAPETSSAAEGMTAAVAASTTTPLSVEGTWLTTVSGPDIETFRALQTYHRDRTYMDTTDILASLAESPGQGTYQRLYAGALVTFELFAFEGTEPVGIVRVTNLVSVGADDILRGDSLVDFIDNDGNVFENVGTGTFTGRRIVPLPFE